MSRYPYSDTGGRIKEARRSIPGYTQKQLARDIGVSTNYIAMLERGSKPLTEGLAYKIGKICLYHPDYLLCKSDFKNAGIPINIVEEHEKSIVFNAFISYLCEIKGYTIESAQFADINDDLKTRIVCSFINGSNKVPVSSGAMYNYFEEIIDFAAYKLDVMLKKEGEINNG